MQTQFQFIVDLAVQYKTYSEDSNALFEAVNNLNKEVVADIYKEYGDIERDFKPVNLVRAEVARKLLEGAIVNEELINEIKDKIRAKDVHYFSHYTEVFLKQFQAYELFTRDLFANWQNNWSVFYSFFYRASTKETVQLYLDQIGKDLLIQLELKDYTFHKVDFQGASNFGSVWSWLALYPISKESHKDSYQFFVRLSATPEAGRMAGHSLKGAKPDMLIRVNSYNELLSSFQNNRSDILQLNKESRNYFKFSPGVQASEWPRFFDEKVIAVDFDFGDLSQYNSREELNISLGLKEDGKSNKAWNLWLFKTAAIGDVVFATKGVNTCLGIGVIQGNYTYKTMGDHFNHRRVVNWITDKVYQYKSDTLKGSKALFRPDTFSPTKVYDFVITEYTRLYPELVEVFAENDLISELGELEQLSENINQKEVPKFLRFINPILHALNKVGGEGKPSEIIKLITDELKFSSSELEEKSKKGIPIIHSHIAWARNYLKAAGLISNEKKGIWSLTKAGKNRTFTQEEIIDLFRNVLTKNQNIDSNVATTLDNEAVEDEIANFWWLNANPKIWKIGNHQEGELQTYTTHNDDGNKRRIYKYFEEFKEGDFIIGYESSPSKAIKAIYRATQGIFQKDNMEQIEFELVKKLAYPVYWNELKNIKDLENCEVFKNNQGSLFKLSESEFNIIQNIIDEKNDFVEGISIGSKIKKYDFANDSDKPFIDKTHFIQAVDLLRRKKNIILQGPPGVGKTFIARKLAYELMHEIKEENIETVQFHQSYSYEDFIQGLRPTQQGSFELRNGLFYTFCQRAINQPEQKFFFIIDEINRGNLSKIFGELMMLIEADKRHEKYALKLTYAEDEEDRFYVPENLFIIGTMNTADRSLAMVDYALRRRFAFVPLQPDYGDNFQLFLKSKGLSVGLVEHICSTLIKLNSKIKNDVGEGFQIGHSYFCMFLGNSDENVWWSEILNFELKPLLEEIWFDDLPKVSEIMKQLSR